MGIGVELISAPAGTSREFQLLVRCGIGVHRGGRRAGFNRTTFAPKLKNPPLDGEQPVETGEHKGPASSAIFLEKLEERQRHAACAQQTRTVAQIIKRRKPFAECGCILLPVAASSLTLEVGRIGAEQIVCLHGQVRKPPARSLKPTGRMAALRNNPRPQGLLLRGVQHEPRFAGATLPFHPCKPVPVEDVRRCPRAEPFGAAGAMAGGADGPCSSIAGRNHSPTRAQPRVNISRRNCPHVRVILRPTVAGQSG